MTITMAPKGTHVSITPVISQQQHTRKRQYRPLSTKSWILVLYMIAMLACFTVFQLLQVYATDFADSSNQKRHVQDTMRWQRRQAASSNVTTHTTSSSLSASTIQTAAPNPANQLTLTSTMTSSSSIVAPGRPASSSQLTLTSSTSLSGTTVGQPAPNAQLTLTSSSSSASTTVGQPAPNAQLTLTTSTHEIIASSAISASQLTLTSKAPTYSSPVPASQLTVTTSATRALDTLSGLVSTSLAQSTRITTSYLYNTGPDAQSSPTYVTSTISHSQPQAPAPSAQMSLTTKKPQSVYLSNSTSQTNSTATTATTSTVQPTLAPGRPAAGSQLALLGRFKEADYFLALYLPKMIAVAFQSLWSVTYAATKLMEPFYQLASTEGASAKHSLLTEYLASGVTLDSITSIFEGRYVLGLSSFIFLLMSLLVSLVSESMTVTATAYCKTEISDHQPCNAAWVINLPIVHLIQALLVILFLLMAVMAFLNQRRQSGIESDPSRLAALIKLLGDHTFTNELRNIHPLASSAEVRGTLRGNVYKLGFYNAASGLRKYGITNASSQVSSGEDFIQNEIGYMAVQNPNMSSHPKPRRRKSAGKIVHDLLLLALVTGLFTLILAYWEIEDLDNPLNKFMNSETFGPHFLLSVAAVIIGFGIKRIEHEIRVTETYRHMSRTSQPADRSVLTSLSQTTFTNLYNGMRRRQWFAAFTGLVTILSEILIIAVTGIPESSAQIALAYKICTFTSLIILGLLIITIVSVLIRRASNPDIPRNPDTLANTLLYLCGSNMVQQHIEVAGDDGSDDKQLIHECAGKQFDFGWSSGVDGRTRWTVNEVTSYNRY